MSQPLHASCVAFGVQGILILGASGTGKSALALELMAIGAELVADDQTILDVQDNQIVALCPKPIKGIIEARGIGLLAAQTKASAIVRFVVDLDKPEPDRLPPHRVITMLGLEVDVIFGKDAFSLAAALKQLVQGGRVA